MITKKNPFVLSDNIEIEIYNEDWQKIRESNSIRKAARDLFIRHDSSIWRYLYIGNKVREKRGVKSKLTGKRYHFKLKQV